MKSVQFEHVWSRRSQFIAHPKHIYHFSFRWCKTFFHSHQFSQPKSVFATNSHYSCCLDSWRTKCLNYSRFSLPVVTNLRQKHSRMTVEQVDIHFMMKFLCLFCVSLCYTVPFFVARQNSLWSLSFIARTRQQQNTIFLSISV